MTGFGEAVCHQDGRTVAVEVRTINSRYFKLSLRAGEGYGSLEPQIEATVRKAVRRGTVQINIRVDRAPSADDYRINVDVLERFRRQLEPLCRQWGVSEAVNPEAMLALPGVIDEKSTTAIDPAADWLMIGPTLQQAMENLTAMRAKEGRAMADDLQENCRSIAADLEKVRARAPQVVDAYRERLQERIQKVLAERDVVLQPADVIREVSLFAERGDISEEVVRLQSHLDQFDEMMQQPESAGRKLEFITQEMFRETNTIGSKANDVEIARHVIEIKAAIERLREMIQNIE